MQMRTCSYEPLLPNMGNVVVRLSQTQFTYNGKAQGPKLTATYAGQPFSGYTVRGGTATNPGTYTVTLRGTGGDSTGRTTPFDRLRYSRSRSPSGSQRP